MITACHKKLDDNSVAADRVDQDTQGIGGKEVTDKPCHVYVVTLRGTDRAYVGITERKVTKRYESEVRLDG